MIVKKDPDMIRSYLEDSSNVKGGHAEEVVIPLDIEELSAFLKRANLEKIPVTISGGGTATTGSRIPFGGTIVSMERFNRIPDISTLGMCAVVESGVLVEDLKAAAEKKGLFYTSHPTEKNAFLGGTVATNASGSRSLKYGPTRQCVKALKMVMATGDIFEVRRGERSLDRNNSRIVLPGSRIVDIPLPDYRMPDVKSSAGYFAKPGMDLIDLFIGQEGTLSVITEIEMALVRKPEGIFSCFVFFPGEPDAWHFAADAGKEHDILSIEYFSGNALKLLRDKHANVPASAGAAIFFEQETSSGGNDAVIGAWLELVKKNNSSVDDTWAAMNESDAAFFTELRYAIPESVNEIVRRSGFSKVSADIAVPDDRFEEMMNFYTTTLAREKLENVIFGHIGESHVHVNILPRTREEAARGNEVILRFVRKAVSFGGTVSAEHGIGKLKHRYLEEMYGKAGILQMARIKKALDPNWILGPDNIFPRNYLDAV